MTQPAPNDFQPTGREIYDRLGQLSQSVTVVRGQQDQAGRDMAKVLADMEVIKAVLFGDRSRGIERGVMERMAGVEAVASRAVEAIEDTLPIVKDLQTKEAARTERDIRADARQRLLLGAASFLGMTNLAGILALIGYLTGVLR